MVYETFLNAITTQLQAKLGEDYLLALRSLPRNNGVTLDGLTIQGPGISMAPTIYLNPYYEQYQKGMSLDEILSDILMLYHTTPQPGCLKENDLSQFEPIKSRIMFRIIHTASNETLLSNVPHFSFLDLSVVFYLFLERNAAGQMTALIHNSHAERWNVTAEELWSLAEENTPGVYPAEIRSMTDMMKEIAMEKLGSSYDEDLIDSLLEDEENIAPLYVLSNANGLYGAGCILYKNVLKNFADSLNRDLIILPSSIHEVLITPDLPGTSYEDLSSMVTCINQKDVPMEDQLSNQVYLYTRADDKISIVSNAGKTVGAAALS